MGDDGYRDAELYRGGCGQDLPESVVCGKGALKDRPPTTKQKPRNPKSLIGNLVSSSKKSKDSQVFSKLPIPSTLPKLCSSKGACILDDSRRNINFYDGGQQHVFKEYGPQMNTVHNPRTSRRKICSLFNPFTIPFQAPRNLIQVLSSY